MSRIRWSVCGESGVGGGAEGGWRVQVGGELGIGGNSEACFKSSVFII